MNHQHGQFNWIKVPKKYQQYLLPGFSSCFSENEQAQFLLQKMTINDSSLHVIRIFLRKPFTIPIRVVKRWLGLSYIRKGNLSLLPFEYQQSNGNCSFAYLPEDYCMKVQIEEEFECVILECKPEIVTRLSEMGSILTNYIKAHQQKSSVPVIAPIHLMSKEIKKVFEDILDHPNDNHIEKEWHALEKTASLVKLVATKIRLLQKTSIEERRNYIIYKDICHLIHQQKSITLEQVAHQFHLSRTLLYDIFNRHHEENIGIGKYILIEKMKYAAMELRKNQLSIAEIAEECGYSDTSNFHNAFVKIYKCTPKQYKNKKQ